MDINQAASIPGHNKLLPKTANFQLLKIQVLTL